MNIERQIVPGITVTPSGQATIAASMQEVLLDLATHLEGPTGLPVDLEHVVAALVLASRNAQFDPHQVIDASEPAWITLLTPHVKTVFAAHGGQLGSDR